MAKKEIIVHGEILTLGERLKCWAKRVKKDLIMLGIMLVLILALAISIKTCAGGNAEPVPEPTAEPTAEPTPEPTPIITNTLVANRLDSVSELTTARIVYNGIISYEEGQIPVLTRNAFFMLYRAEVTAGVDLNDASVAITDTQLRIVLPAPQITGVHIDSESIEFYDVKSSWFNPADRDDAINAIQEAENDVQENGGIPELLAQAREQTERILCSIFDDVAGELEISVQFEE